MNLYQSIVTRRVHFSGSGLQAPRRFKGSPCHHGCIIVPRKCCTCTSMISTIFIHTTTNFSSMTLLWIRTCPLPHQRRRCHLYLAGTLSLSPCPTGGNSINRDYIGCRGMVMLQYIWDLLVACSLVDYWF